MFIYSTVFGAITGCALLASPVAALALPSADNSEHATQALQKRIDLEDACYREYGSDWEAIKNGSGCDDWACLNTSTQQEKGLNLNLYCYETVGVNSYASCTTNAWGWSCK